MAMIEPGVRYLPMVPIPSQSVSLEAAVDLTKKSDHWKALSHHDTEDGDDGGSDSDTPLDMSVTATIPHHLSPVFPGFQRPDRDLSPARSDRSDFMLRLPGLYSPGSARERSADRSDLDKDEFTRDACHICGMPRSEMSAYQHGEGVCNQRPIGCPLCSKTFTLWSHYETHKKCHQKLKQRQYPCQSCGKIFTSASNRNMHQRIHKGVRPFQCAPCGVYFRQKAHLQKHQRTQGHIQASELYEKRKAEGLIQEPDISGKKEESEGSETRSEDLNTADSSISSNPESEDSKHEDFRRSPKRKQSHPQQSTQSFDLTEDKVALNPRDAQVNINIEFNTQTHGYDCRQCDFSSHDHALMKEHVVNDHLRDKADLQCKECMVTFTKPFNLKIHIRKHETSSQFLPCEYCEQVFKVPNKLIKHMEGVHNVCPTCGDKNPDKAGLQEHMEKIHNEPRKGVHASLQHLSSLTSFHPSKHRQDLDSRHAKIRKIDSLADHIRAKQLQNATGTNVINGNETKPASPDQHVIRGRRKSDLHHLLAGWRDRTPEKGHLPGLEKLVDHLNKINSHHQIRSENNNILSGLGGKMTEFPPHHHLPPRYPPETPPVSPPHSSPDTAFTRIGHSNTFVLNNNPVTEPESDDSNETGLDLTVKKEPNKSDENEVSTTGDSAGQEEAFKNRHLINTTFPHPLIVPALPFPISRMPLSPLPHHNSFTEHLFKLASITRPPTLPQDLSKPTTSLASSLAASHHSVHPAMLASVFPVFPGGLPASMFPQHPLPPSAGEERAVSPPAAAPAGSEALGLESKPFRCNYCPKEFGHLSSLESHVERLHTNEAKHNCEVCGKAYSSKSNLTAHKKIHSGERPFECAVCQKRFRQKAHLQKHETTHSSATPYQCPHCDKAFGHPSNLNTHIATHSDVRPYECSDCGKSYKDSASFKRHRMVHTGERPYPCTLCSETFIDSKSLRRHREVSHPTAVPDPDLDVMEEEEEELIEPGQEQQYLPVGEEVESEDEGVVSGIAESDESKIDDEMDESYEGGLKIAENLADSGNETFLEERNL